jgi:hypothetical protein
MIGPRRPSASGRPRARAWTTVAWLALALARLSCAAAATEDAGDVAPKPAVRLRLEWGSGATRRWQGTIAVSEGELARPAPLGIEPDVPGSMWVEEGRLVVRQPSARPYDGVDFDVSAPLDATLIVALSPVDAPTSGEPIQIPLGQLLKSTYSTRLDERKNVVQIQRAPGDKLRIEIEREALIFQPGESLEMTVTPNYLSDAANAHIRLQARLLGVTDKAEASVQEQYVDLDEEGSAAGISFAITLPQREGVYDVDLQPSRQRLGLSQAIQGGRRIQVLVLSRDPRLPDSTTELPLEPLVEIDPAKPSWWQRLPNIPMFPSLRKPLGSGDMSVRRFPLGELVEIGAARSNVGWEAYPLPIQKPGEPHIVEVQYPSDLPQVLGMSVVEPNQTGVLAPIGLDSGVYVPDDGNKSAAQMAVHRLVFWPRTQTPLLRLDGTKAVYGRIRVLGPKHANVATVLQRDDWQTHSMLPRRFPAGDGLSGRLLAGYYDRPLFCENFSASKTLDPVRKFYFHDWRTFYEGGTRLVEYLHYIGHSGLMLTVMADGSALYPSELVEPTPRHDTGAYFASAQDPHRKDVLEMLFRLFDREGLALIPSIDFSTPLPALEAIRRDDEQAGLELIGSDGQPWLKRHPPRQQLAPYYNPLDERVQNAMIDVVRELVSRYRQHPSFGGVALQLTANGYAQLPGADCGFDRRTLERFQAATKVKLPSGDGGYASHVAPLMERERPKWLAWRAASMAEFYRRMQAEMATQRPGLKLYLAGSALFDRPELARELRPVLARVTSKNEETLASVGIDPKQFADDKDIVLLRPNRIAPLRSLAAQAVNLEVNLDQQIDHLFAELPTGAALFYHEPQEGRLESFDEKNPFNKGTPSRLVVQAVPSGAANRRRFVHAVAALDARAIFDGGRLLPIGQEHEMGSLVAAFRALPDLPFEAVAGDSQPVTVRTLSHSGRTYVYFANDSPWKVKVRVTVEKPAECTVLSHYPGKPVGAPSGEGFKQTWTVSLEAYDLLSAHFSTTNVKLSSPVAELDDTVVAQLKSQIQDLTSRARVLKEPEPLDVPVNREFEQASRGGIAGWESTPASLGLRGAIGQPTDVTLDSKQPHSGRFAARLSARANKVSITSSPFAPPATGWLLVSVWLRASDADKPPKLTIALEGRLGNSAYRAQTQLPAAANEQRLNDEWREFRFAFANMPTEGLSPLRLIFTCEGNGDVWVDDLRLFDLDKLEGDELMTLVWLAIQRAGAKLDKREYADCWQLLDGYWPRYLRSFVPLTQEPIANHPRTRRASTSAPPPKTGLYDRMKDGLRSMWR